MFEAFLQNFSYTVIYVFAQKVMRTSTCLHFHRQTDRLRDGQTERKKEERVRERESGS